jgi:hypothetical protein
MFAKVLLTLSLLTSVAASINDCGGGKSMFTVNALGFWPDPAFKNANSTISYDYTVPTTINSGTAEYSVTYNFIPLSPTIEDLCTQTKCPILPGQYNQSSSSIFPDVSGSITIKTRWFDNAKNLLLCTFVQTKVN